MPAHFPAAVGPANVCVTAQTLDVKMPRESEEAISHTRDVVGLSTRTAGTMKTAQRSRPATRKALRTTVGEAPARTHRPEAHPPAMEVTAIPQKGSDPNTAIALVEKCRSLTR